MQYAHELSIAVAAVRHAADVCRNVQRAIPAAMEKQDKSPVTIADFASQAVICRALGEAFPNDPIIGEEDSAELRLLENGRVLLECQQNRSFSAIQWSQNQRSLRTRITGAGLELRDTQGGRLI